MAKFHVLLAYSVLLTLAHHSIAKGIGISNDNEAQRVAHDMSQQAGKVENQHEAWWMKLVNGLPGISARRVMDVFSKTNGHLVVQNDG
jgi:hypothetical protein